MYLETLVNYINKCDAILKEVFKVHTHLDVLEKQHKFVSEQTHALHNACEHSLQEQVIGKKCFSLSYVIFNFQYCFCFKLKFNFSYLSLFRLPAYSREFVLKKSNKSLNHTFRSSGSLY